VFSIWGLIYLGLIAYTIYHSLPAQAENPRLQRTGWWVALTSLANGAWIYVWHYGLYPASLLIMFVLLAALLVIYLRLDIGRARFDTRENLLVRLPFSIYLGWITVATIANITAVLADLNWNGWGLSDLTWTLIVLVAGVVIAAIMAFTRADLAYLLVLAWAFVGISVRFLDLSVLNVAGFAAAGAVLLLVVLAITRSGPRQRLQTA
jgi:translocator protein